MFSEPVAVAGDLDHDGVVQQPVQERGGHDSVAEHFAPLAETAVGRQDDGTALVAGIDELEEQVRAALLNGQVRGAAVLDFAEESGRFEGTEDTGGRRNRREARARWPSGIDIPVLEPAELDAFLEIMPGRAVNGLEAATDPIKQYELFLRILLDLDDWRRSRGR